MGPSTQMGSSQNQGPALLPLKKRCRNMIYSQKGPIILRTTQTERLRIGVLGSKIQRLRLQRGSKDPKVPRTQITGLQGPNDYYTIHGIMGPKTLVFGSLDP